VWRTEETALRDFMVYASSYAFPVISVKVSNDGALHSELLFFSGLEPLFSISEIKPQHFRS
jgi:hypothetical protein